MTNRVIPILKLMALVLTVALAFFAILYVLDVFSADHLRRIAVKVMAIMAILTAASLVTIFVSTTGKD